MRSALALAAVLAAAPVAAQPAAQSERCRVTIARAPDDVRPIVEAWVRAEPKCNIALEIRIVPTDGGLYLLVRDEYGRVRERVVPDAQSAGVLVASWVAADSVNGSPFQVRQPREPARVDEPVVIGSVGTSTHAAPSEVPAIAATHASPAPKWLALGGMFAMSGTGGGGIRGELDLKARGLMSIGLASSASRAGMMVQASSYEEMGWLDTFDAKFLAYLGLTAGGGGWYLRSAVGAGLVYTAATLDQGGWDYREARGLFPTGEATLSIARDLGSRWALYGGPIVSLYIQEYQIETTAPGYQSRTLQRRDMEAMMFIGVRHRL